jgi:hypothetical protein
MKSYQRKMKNEKKIKANLDQKLKERNLKSYPKFFFQQFSRSLKFRNRA